MGFELAKNLPLIIKDVSSGVKFLDTLELHVDYALEVFFSENSIF